MIGSIMWGALTNWWAVLILGVCAGGSLLIWSRERARLRRLISPEYLESRYSSFAPKKHTIRLILQLGGYFCIAIAFLQPQWGMREQVIEQSGRDVLVLLDISRSMYAQDFKPNRLELMKNKIRQLTGKLSFERVGLILFSGTAFVQCPLTSDYKAFLMFLSQVTPESLSSGTTSLRAPLVEAARVFSRSKGRKHKLVVLVTDGEEFVSDIRELGVLAQQEKMTLYAWGVGSEFGAPVPVVSVDGQITGYEKDESGGAVMTRLNSSLLRELAQAANGAYIEARYDMSDISEIVTYLGRHERESFDEQRSVSRFEDQYQWFVGSASIFLLLAFVL